MQCACAVLSSVACPTLQYFLAINITYSECAFVALGFQHAMRVRHIVICGLPNSTIFFFTLSHKRHVRRDSSVSIATRYGLDAPGIESRWGEIFYTRSDWPWGPPSLLYNGYRVLPGVKAAGA
jgi:hypothetical protein